MKKYSRLIRFLTLCLAMMMLAVPTVSAAYSDADVVTLSGKGSVSVPADTAVLNFNIETRGTDRADAVAQNDKILKTLKDSLSKYGTISEESFYSYVEPENGPTVFTRSLSLKTEKVKSIPEITQKLLDGGTASSYGVCYCLKDDSAQQKEALKLALADAEAKAAALGLNMNLKRIKESGCYTYYDTCTGQGNGMISVVCDVSVIFSNKPGEPR